MIFYRATTQQSSYCTYPKLVNNIHCIMLTGCQIMIFWEGLWLELAAENYYWLVETKLGSPRMTRGCNRWNYPEHIATKAMMIGMRQYLPKNEFNGVDFPGFGGLKTKSGKHLFSSVASYDQQLSSSNMRCWSRISSISNVQKITHTSSWILNGHKSPLRANVHRNKFDR